MLNPLELSLAVLAFVAGLTGAWSPCGFSMVETLGGTGHDGGRRLTLSACATFTVGTLVGGIVTFAGLALFGALARLGGDGAPVAVAASVAALAAAAELRGVRIVPQIRRQVPEHWRRTMPLQLAAALYGLLLGLGFTTFVLTFAVWALAGISTALADPALGALIGAAFGFGRALPVVVLAPLVERPRGMRIAMLMAERPATLRAFRLADAAALTLTALLLATGSASAASTLAQHATDPAIAGDALAWQDTQLGAGVLRTPASTQSLPGRDPAVSASFVAWHVGDVVTIARRDTLAPIGQVAIPGVDKLALSDSWLAYRTVAPGLDRIFALPLGNPADQRLLAGAIGSAQLGRPALEGDVVVFHYASRSASRIVAVNIPTGRHTVLRRALRTAPAQLLNPSARAGKLLYVRVTDCYQELRLGSLGSDRHERLLLRLPATARRDSGSERHHTTQGRRPSACPARPAPAAVQRVLWTTALSPTAAYVTQLRIVGGVTTPAIVRVER